MRVGVISGSGSHLLADPVDQRPRVVSTPYGWAEVVEAPVGPHQVVHVGRHGADGSRLSHQVDHRGNLAALREVGVDALISLTACATVDPDLTPGCVIVFDDLYYPGNRLPDGSLCTWFEQPGPPGQGHWIAQRPFSQALREALIASVKKCRLPYVIHAGYGHVDGPRYCTASEATALFKLGVSAISQTAGPEVVLAGEAGIPMALVGYVTGYANGAGHVPESVDVLERRMCDSERVFAALLGPALLELDDLQPVGVVHRFELDRARPSQTEGGPVIPIEPE
jgi:5'-methylthioadenosine phosphorylase